MQDTAGSDGGATLVATFVGLLLEYRGAVKQKRTFHRLLALTFGMLWSPGATPSPRRCSPSAASMRTGHRFTAASAVSAFQSRPSTRASSSNVSRMSPPTSRSCSRLMGSRSRAPACAFRAERAQRLDHAHDHGPWPRANRARPHRRAVPAARGGPASGGSDPDGRQFTRSLHTTARL